MDASPRQRTFEADARRAMAGPVGTLQMRDELPSPHPAAHFREVGDADDVGEFPAESSPFRRLRDVAGTASAGGVVTRARPRQAARLLVATDDSPHLCGVLVQPTRLACTI